MTTVPTIHLNGTGRETLTREYEAAYAAVVSAIDSLCDATCHGRDFYPQGDDAYYRARSERDEALGKLRDARQYIEEILLGISNQV